MSRLPDPLVARTVIDRGAMSPFIINNKKVEVKVAVPKSSGAPEVRYGNPPSLTKETYFHSLYSERNSFDSFSYRSRNTSNVTNVSDFHGIVSRNEGQLRFNLYGPTRRINSKDHSPTPTCSSVSTTSGYLSDVFAFNESFLHRASSMPLMETIEEEN